MKTKENKGFCSPRIAPEFTLQTQSTPSYYKLPVIWWAAVGGGVIVLQSYIFCSWILSSNFATVVAPESKISPELIKNARIFEISSIFLFCVCAVYCFIKSRREGKVSWDALLMISGVSVFWLDAATNFFKPIIAYNSVMFNKGTWAVFFPGWVLQEATITPEPILFVIPLFGWWFLLSSMLFCFIDSNFMRIYPKAGLLKRIIVGWIVLSVFNGMLELNFLHSGLYAYVSSTESLTLWPGTLHQYPLYNPVILGGLCVSIALLRSNAERNGFSFVEKGFYQLNLPQQVKTLLRLLAIIGYTNMTFIIALLVYFIFTINAEPLPNIPEYFRG